MATATAASYSSGAACGKPSSSGTTAGTVGKNGGQRVGVAVGAAGSMTGSAAAGIVFQNPLASHLARTLSGGKQSNWLDAAQEGEDSENGNVGGGVEGGAEEDDRDEIAQIEDPLDCLEETTSSCGVFWGEGAL